MASSGLASALKAGAATGALAGLAFAVAHALLIAPVAFLFALAPAGGVVQGVAVGWAWHQVRRARPDLRGILFGAAYAAALLPVGALSVVADCEDEAGAATAGCLRVLALPPVLLLAAAALSTRRPLAAFAAGLSGLLLVFPIGAQALAAGDRPGVGWDTAFFGAILLILVGAGVVLERTHRRLAPPGTPA